MNNLEVTEKSHLQAASNKQSIFTTSIFFNKIMKRRMFLGNCLSLLTFLTFPRCTRLEISGTDGARPLKSSDTIFKLFRPLNGVLPLPGDKEVLSLISSWLKSVILAKQRHVFPFDTRNVAQLSNLRRDTNGYFIKTYDTDFLQFVLEKAENPTANVKRFFQAGFSDVEPVFGNLYWLRQIRKHPKKKDHKKTALLGAITDLVAAEVYWLDIWVRVNNFAIPGFRVFWDSIGLIPSHEIGAETDVLPDIASEESQVFMDFDRVILNWHELAEEMSITGNLYYLKACFYGSDLNVFGISPPGWNGFVYIGPNGYQSRWDLTIDPNLSLAEQVDNWRISGSIKSSIRNDLQALLHYLNVESLLKIDNSIDLDRIRDIEPGSDAFPFQLIVESGSTINLIPRPALNDDSVDGQNLIYFYQQLIPSAEYLGNGMFSIQVSNSGITASENEVRQSTFSIGVLVETAATPAGGAVGGTAGVGAIVTNKFIDWIMDRDEERDENLRLIDKYAKEICVPTSQTAAECKECVLDSQALQEELGALKTKYAVEAVGAAGAVGVACGVGAAIGAWFFGIGAAIGCAIGALAGLLVSAAEAWSDYNGYKDAVRETMNTAFGPCDELPTITIGDPEIGDG